LEKYIEYQIQQTNLRDGVLISKGSMGEMTHLFVLFQYLGFIDLDAIQI